VITLTGLTLVFVLFFASAAIAIEMYSPPLFPTSGQFFLCQILNKSAVAQAVRIRIFNSAGALVLNAGPFALLPNRTSQINSAVGGQLHCSFTVGSSSNFRANASIYVNGDYVAIPAY
jgi:hypothetical protein